jgi:pyruvate/2-oxoglutarate dehydrogenase complex dihydrolipoamide dehydrogenase (E3) component
MNDKEAEYYASEFTDAQIDTMADAGDFYLEESGFCLIPTKAEIEKMMVEGEGSNQILELKTLPKRLAVIGAGVIGSEYACVFAALGAELNLPAAGLKPGERGLLSVDLNYRTEVPHIYAVGDVIGSPALASTSIAQARVAPIKK